jgi:tRNA 5-methylaminomethyl-2-thiouridine biosynthesis bifunctional protein
LVRAWLTHANIRFVGSAHVQTLQQDHDGWTLLDANGSTLAQAQHVVFASAMGSQNLLQMVPPDTALVDDLLGKLGHLEALHGLLSSGDAVVAAHTDAPANGSGSYVSGVPTQTGLKWFAGATFETDASRLLELADQHSANYDRLQALLPEVGDALKSTFMKGAVQAWTGTRCVTHDRLPLVGALQKTDKPTLWINAGMGARGLSFSALCAQWLVALMCCEPWPVEAPLAQGLNVQRPRRKRA